LYDAIRTRERIKNIVHRWSNRFIEKDVRKLESLLISMLEVSELIKPKIAEILKGYCRDIGR
jgi:hypothetical protein